MRDLVEQVQELPSKVVPKTANLRVVLSLPPDKTEEPTQTGKSLPIRGVLHLVYRHKVSILIAIDNCWLTSLRKR
jgi:hypothetical protein